MNDKEKETNRNNIVCSSSKDKMALKKVFTSGSEKWLDHPSENFPKDLLQPSSPDSVALTSPLIVVDAQGGGTWFKPTNLVELLALLKEFSAPGTGGCKIVVGNTEVGIGTYSK